MNNRRANSIIDGASLRRLHTTLRYLSTKVLPKMACTFIMTFWKEANPLGITVRFAYAYESNRRILVPGPLGYLGSI